MSGDLEGLVELGGVVVAEGALLAGHARTHCPNCGARFDGPYCAHCGQERDTHRRTVGHLLHDFFEDILSFDSRILRTARALVSQPGELSCAFRDGRTRAYVPPIRLYFFVTLLFFLILSVSGIAILKLDVHTHIMTAKEVARIQKSVTASETTTKGAAGSGKVNFNLVVGGSNTIKAGATYPSFTTRFFAPLDTAPRSISPQVQKGLDQMKADFAKAKAAMAAKGEKPGFGDWIIDRIQTTMTTLAHDPTAINGPLTTWIPRALFLLLPIFAGLLALFHWRQRQTYFFVDHLVFSLNVHSFGFVVLIAAVWLAQVLSGGTVGWLVLAAVGIYLLVAMKRFYGQSWVRTATKFAFVSFIYTVFFLLPALGIVIAVSALEA